MLSRMKTTGINKIIFGEDGFSLGERGKPPACPTVGTHPGISGSEVVEGEEPTIRVKRTGQWVGGDAEKPGITATRRGEF